MELNTAPVSKQKQELKFKINLIFLPKFKKPAQQAGTTQDMPSSGSGSSSLENKII